MTTRQLWLETLFLTKRDLLELLEMESRRRFRRPWSQLREDIFARREPPGATQDLVWLGALLWADRARAERPTS